MPIPVICGCTAKLKIADGLMGQNVKCPKCKKVLPVSEPKPDHPYYNLYAAGPPNGAKAAPSGPTLTTEQVLSQSPLTAEQRGRVELELDGDERLLWAGRPDRQIAFRRGWIIASAWFFMTLMAVIVLIVLNVSMDEFGVMGNLLVILVILITIAGGVATPYYKAWLADKQFYTVSNKRATIWGCNKFGKVLPPSHFNGAELHGFYFKPAAYWGEGVGELIFGSKTVTQRRGKETFQVTYTWGFFMLRNAKEVEKIIRHNLVDPVLDKAYE